MKKRVAAMAGLAMLASLTLEAAIPTAAQAQSGWRLCGNFWQGRNNGAIYAEAIKIRKNDPYACRAAIGRTQRMRDHNMPPEVANQPWDGRRSFRVTCENLGEFLHYKYGDDPCYGMLGASSAFAVAGRTPSKFWWSP